MYIMSVWPMPKWLVILVDVVGVSRKNAPGGGVFDHFVRRIIPTGDSDVGIIVQ